MKLLFRAKKENMWKFLVYCVFLLYLVAIAIVNINSFSTTGYFWGLNPLPAFGPDLILSTIVFYIIAVIASILSVSSFFITRDKGFGFAGEKNDPDGYEKMADEKAVKKWPNIERVILKEKNYKAAGVPFILNKKEAYVNNGEDHTIIIGSTGSGKTECGILPTARILAKAGESMIITDPKGEIYQKIGALLKEEGYKIILLNFRDPQRGNSWNPFALPYKFHKEGKEDKSMELLEDLGANILTDPNSKSNDPFWENASKDYFTALSMGLFEDAPEEAININSVNLMVTQGDHKCGRSFYDREYFTMKGEETPMYNKASAVINTAQDTKMGVLSTFRTKTGIFSSRRELSEMLARSDFDMSTIGREKTAVFMMIHDEKKTYHALLTIFVKQVYESLIDEAFKCEGGKLPIRTNFLLDEFANMPALKDVDSMITASRSRNIRFTFIIQNFSQLNQVYGADMAETIKGNCNIHFLLTTELKALEEISKLCGDKKPPKAKEGQPQEPIRPLVTVSDLQHMKKFEYLIKRMRFSPFKTVFTPDFQLKKENAWNCSYDVLPFPQREFRTPEVFNLIEFVDKKKAEMGESTEGGMMGGNPFAGMGMPFAGMGGSPGFNPFAAPQSRPAPMPTKEIDFEALAKNIDARIAEMEKADKEAEERAKAESSVEEKPSNTEKTDILVEPKVEIPFEEDESFNVLPEEDPVNIQVNVNPTENKTDASFEKKEEPIVVESKPQSINIQVNPTPVESKVDVPFEEKEEPIAISNDVAPTPVNNININLNIPSTEPVNVTTNVPENKVEEVDTNIDKPKVNVDSDSIIVDDNLANDDFFDDFFDEE